MGQIIIAYKHPCDYVEPEKRDELSDIGIKRVEILHQRITKDFYKYPLIEVKILTEYHLLDDMHETVLLSHFGDKKIEVIHIIDYQNLVAELGDLSEDQASFHRTIFLFLHVDSRILAEMRDRINEVCLYSMIPTGIIPPLSDDELGVIMDDKFLKQVSIYASKFEEPKLRIAAT